MLQGLGSARVTIGTVVRSFSYYVPPGLDPNQAAAPLVILPPGVSRGAMMNGADTIALTGFVPIADREGLVLVAPESNGLPFPWNVGAGSTAPGGALDNRTAKDQEFVDSVIAYVQADRCIDAKHMFASGFSVGGGYFTNELGCLRKDLAGIAPHSSGTHLLAGCPGTRKPVILFHGTADTIVDYQATAVRAPGGTRFEWLWRNACTVSANPIPVKTEAVRGGTCEYYECRAPAPQVALCSFDGMENLWAGSSMAGVGDPARESAAELAWRFWKTYAW